MDLIQAVEAGDRALVKTLLNNERDLNYQNEFGRSALESAVACGHLDISELLLKAGANPDLENSVTGWTPIMYAADLDRSQEMKLLQHHGASINAKHGKEGVNAVHIVCRNGSASGFRTLIIKGASTSTRDAMGRIPLHYAAATGNVQLVSLLLRWHSDPSAQDKNGLVALDTNSELYKEASRLLIPGVKGEGLREFYRVACSDRPDVDGLYEKVHDDCYQRARTTYTLVRSPDTGTWGITDGSQYVLQAADSAELPVDARQWQYRKPSNGRITSGAVVTITKPVVQHVGCDECDLYPVVGDAYYCAVRHDFDLCGDCERKCVQPYPTVKFYEYKQRPGQFVYTCHLAEELSSVPTFHFDPTMVHEGVTCQQCRVSPIVGPRFKCTVRQEYDLCSACEAQQDTRPHAMIKIYDPRHHPSHIEYRSREHDADCFTHDCAFPEHLYCPQAVDEASGADYEFDPVHVVTPPAPEPQQHRPHMAFGGAPTIGTARGPMLSFGVESFKITCNSLPALDGVYALVSEDHYQALGKSAYTMVRHSMDTVWCVSDGTRFLARAVDDAPSPSEVKVWECLVDGRRWTKCADMAVAKH